MEGERNDDAGGYGVERYCLDCAGPEAQAAVGDDVAERVAEGREALDAILAGEY